MKRNSIKIISDGYFLLNEHQNFYFDKQKAKNILGNIKFPILVFDCEFINYHHDFTNFKEKLYDYQNKDLVYVIQYSFAKSLKEIANRDNKKTIKSMTIKRDYNDKNYDFFVQYKKMIISFLSMCRNKEIKTIVCAGSTNDIKIINKWIYDNKKLFARQKLQLLVINKDKTNLSANYFDIYWVLKNCFSFSNTTKEGQQFWIKQNLPNGKQDEDMIALTSSKKFFDWFEDINKTPLKEEKEDIEELCQSSYFFYSYPKNYKITFDEYIKMQKKVKKVIDHCYNDVLKILEFLSFVYEFAYLPYLKNNYIKKD